MISQNRTKRLCFHSSLMVGALIVASACLAAETDVSLKRSYSGPPRDKAEYDHGFPAYMGCMTTFGSHIPPTKAFNDVIENAMTSFLRESPGVLMDHVIVDERKKTISVFTKDYSRTARYYAGYGCALLPPGRDDIYVSLSDPEKLAPDPDITGAAGKLWPIGERVSQTPKGSFDQRKLASAMEMLFDKDKSTQAILVVKDGRIILERYGEGYGPQSRLASYSLTKSLTATLFGLVQHDGLATVNDFPPFPEWAHPDDPRRSIKIGDLMRMSSGLDIPNDEEPWKYTGPVRPEDELYANTVDINRFSLQQRFGAPPGQNGRYREMNPQLVMLSAQRLLNTKGEDWRRYLQKRLFDPLHIGQVDFVIDAYGNPHAYAFSLMRPRDWARLGLLYLNRGKWFDRQLIGSDFVDFVSTPAPGWIKDQQQNTIQYGITYGAGFWVAHPHPAVSDRLAWVPKDSLLMVGYGDQLVMIIPSLNAIVLRFGDVPASTRQSQINTLTGEPEDVEASVIEPAIKILVSALK